VCDDEDTALHTSYHSEHRANLPARQVGSRWSSTGGGMARCLLQRYHPDMFRLPQRHNGPKHMPSKPIARYWVFCTCNARFLAAGGVATLSRVAQQVTC
jgi:hypothetical protein